MGLLRLRRVVVAGTEEGMNQPQDIMGSLIMIGSKNDNLSEKFKSYSFGEIRAIDEEITADMKQLAAEGVRGANRANAVSEKAIMLLEAAPKVAENVKSPDEYDAIEEIVNRWTGYLTYHKLFAPAALLPPAP